MRIRRFLRIHFAAVWLAILFLAITFCELACNNPVPSSLPGSTHWIQLTIKFKPNTNEVMRDSAIRAIERVVIDSALTWRSNKHISVYPMVSIIHSTSSDSLSYALSLDAATSAADTIGPPPCKCKTNCGVCQMLTTAVLSAGPGDPYLHVDSVLSVE